jgi:hypothetical protein
MTKIYEEMTRPGTVDEPKSSSNAGLKTALILTVVFVVLCGAFLFFFPRAVNNSNSTTATQYSGNSNKSFAAGQAVQGDAIGGYPYHR